MGAGRAMSIGAGDFTTHLHWKRRRGWVFKLKARVVPSILYLAAQSGRQQQVTITPYTSCNFVPIVHDMVTVAPRICLLDHNSSLGMDPLCPIPGLVPMIMRSYTEQSSDCHAEERKRWNRMGRRRGLHYQRVTEIHFQSKKAQFCYGTITSTKLFNFIVALIHVLSAPENVCLPVAKSTEPPLETI